MHLFVYGTLRKTPSPRSNSDSHQRFLSNALYCGTASVAGQLISLGSYPALILDEHSNHKVKGEIFKIDASDLQTLDEYEEIDPHSSNNEYQRIHKNILADSGDEYFVWIYVLDHSFFVKNQDKYDVIESGDWCAE
jgi:gamma-glutamylcyclotransferase (GGCT)/AIG2-like uncharacterized protein YtfP